MHIKGSSENVNILIYGGNKYLIDYCQYWSEKIRSIPKSDNLIKWRKTLRRKSQVGKEEKKEV